MRSGSGRRVEVARIETGSFPKLPIPIPIPFPPMEARRGETLPQGPDWQFEPKWDGFRALVFRWRDQVFLQSKAGQPLGRYFPELVEAFLKLTPQAFVLDGEIVIPIAGRLSFDDLLMRIHPAQSRISRLSEETPALFNAFDLLYEAAGKPSMLLDLPLSARRKRLEQFFRKVKSPSIDLTPMTTDRVAAGAWFKKMGELGLDGIIAKRLDRPYQSGSREAMVKVKRLRTADCVVGGFRYASGSREIGSLLLGLYDEQGLLNHVGFTSSFNVEERRALKKVLEKVKGGSGFSGKAPGGPSRWSTERSAVWEALKPKLVCEVRYDYFSQRRFRHGTKFLRWRPEKKPRTCTIDQV
ncbi:MAG: ATP-dependent DNA ligase [Acidobacteriota bacterium]